MPGRPGKEPPPSLWYYLDAGADDLEGLFYQINDQPRSWTSAPPKDKIKGTDAHLRQRKIKFDGLKEPGCCP